MKYNNILSKILFSANREYIYTNYDAQKIKKLIINTSTMQIPRHTHFIN